MKTANLSSQATRISDVGLVWKLLNNATTDTQEVPKFSTLYIKALADCVVSLDGEDAIKLNTNDVVVINSGSGVPKDGKETVTVAFTGSVNCSLAEEKIRR